MSKVKCLFGHHTFIKYDDDDVTGFKCSTCNFSFKMYDGEDNLGTFAMEHGPDFSQHPYFYDEVWEHTVTTNVPLTDDEVRDLAIWIEKWYEEQDQKAEVQ